MATSKGMKFGPRRVDIVGERFGRFLVLTDAGTRYRGLIAFWLCLCDCGNVREVQGSNLRNGKSLSCGCLNADNHRTHGYEGTPVYNVWSGMKQRCQNTKYKQFAYYGGRGIKVCKRWQRFETFLADMGERPDGKSLDRIDNNGNYEPGNCRWATPLQQMKNRRPSKPRSS